jgi:uncharacterized protein (TIGR03083 family)
LSLPPASRQPPLGPPVGLFRPYARAVADNPDRSVAPPAPEPPRNGSRPPGIVADSSLAGVRAQLEAVWASIGTLTDDLTPEQWATPTACPGWTVADQVAHIVGTESMLAGRPAPPPGPGPQPPHVRNDIGQVNEAWLDHYRAAGLEALLRDFGQVTSERLRQLAGMDDADLERPSWTPVGQATYGRFLQVRVFDCWVHEQDIREAIGRPGHLEGPAAEQATDEVVRALGYLVGKRAAAPSGSRVRIKLTGPVRRTVDVAVADRAQVVEPAGEPTAMVALASDLFLRLACGRRPAAPAIDAGAVSLSGDAELARSVVEHLAYTI